MPVVVSRNHLEALDWRAMSFKNHTNVRHLVVAKVMKACINSIRNASYPFRYCRPKPLRAMREKRKPKATTYYSIGNAVCAKNDIPNTLKHWNHT